jgi:hypothetical protein
VEPAIARVHERGHEIIKKVMKVRRSRKCQVPRVSFVSTSRLSVKQQQKQHPPRNTLHKTNTIIYLVVNSFMTADKQILNQGDKR